MLTTDPATGRAAAAAELQPAGTATKSLSRQITDALTLVTATCNPGAASVLAQARAAAVAGQLKPVATITGIYNLTPLNQLLKAAGQAAVTS
jgi:hypothetical protein